MWNNPTVREGRHDGRNAPERKPKNCPFFIRLQVGDAHWDMRNSKTKAKTKIESGDVPYSKKCYTDEEITSPQQMKSSKSPRYATADAGDMPQRTPGVTCQRVVAPVCCRMCSERTIRARCATTSPLNHIHEWHSTDVLKQKHTATLVRADNNKKESAWQP